MLIIGDAATKKYNEKHKVKIMEIIYHDKDELQFIINTHSLKNLTYNSPTFQEFKEGTLVYRLYSKANGLVLNKVLRDSFAGRLQTKVANPFYNFIFDTLKVIQYHEDVSIWENALKSYTFLCKNYIEGLIDHNEEFNVRIGRYHNFLRRFYSKTLFPDKLPYMYSRHSQISRRELLTIVTETYVNKSPLHMISTEVDGEFNEAKFDALSHPQKITACVECLYVDVLNEYVIPQIQETRISPSERAVKLAFKKCVMARASQRIEPWFGFFMINFYTEIMKKYHISFYTCFKNALYVGEIHVATK
ncbi:MAG: hypothetical protein KUG81_08715 [Gammaproteobacteria bacterium]|nr:hypothetical protein [Gammaproteobacteria bacterium]